MTMPFDTNYLVIIRERTDAMRALTEDDRRAVRVYVSAVLFFVFGR